MASHPPPILFTKEATNYARLCRLLIEVGSQVLREKFNDIHDPANLHVILHSCMPKLKSLRSRRILSQAQWDSMNPAVHATVSSENFDISTLCVLLINICNLSPPATGWRRPPAPTDHSVGADILRVRHFRNSLYAHVTKASIDETSFNSYWNDIREVLVRLGGAKYDVLIRKVKTECMDPDTEEDYKSLLKEWQKQDDDIRDRLESIDEKTEKTHELLIDLKDHVVSLGGIPDTGESQLQLSIEEELTDDDFEKLNVLCGLPIPVSRLETAKRPRRERFCDVPHYSEPSDENKHMLSSLLYHIGRMDLRNRLLGVQEAALTKSFKNVGGIPCEVPNFVGRKGQRSLIMEKLSPSDPCRIVSITGPPGFGKSAVAIQVGRELVSKGKMDVFYITLKSMRSLNDMVNSLLGALQILAGADPIQQAKHCLRTLSNHTIIILDNVDDMLLPEKKDAFCNFVKSVAQTASRVKFTITSRQVIDFLSVNKLPVCLDSLCPDHAKELLLTLESRVSEEDAEQLAHYCGGVPLVLRTTAAVLAKGIDAKALLSEFQTSLVPTLKSFKSSLPTLSHDHQLFHCLEICFSRLQPDQQTALVSLAVFPRTFSAVEAQFLFSHLSQYRLGMLLQGLVDQSMLQFNFMSKEYHVHNIIQSFCVDRAVQEDMRLQYHSARKLFNVRYLEMIQDLYAVFLSHNCCDAVQKFVNNRFNIKKALKDSLSFPDLEKKCIDTAVEVTPFLAKVFTKAKFLRVYSKFTNACIANGDKKRRGDCLTAEAYGILSHCACHLPCPSAVSKFKEADKIQKELGDDSSIIRAFCLSKLGRCFGQHKDLDQAILLIKKSIEIGEKKNNRIFTAAAYKDLGAAYAFCGDHQEANKIREEYSLPVYLEFLGDHPFTATLMDDLGTSYQALENYGSAIKFLRKALHIRKHSLGNHQVTARSFYDFGKALAMKEELDEALEALRSALAIQDEVLGNHQETERSHREIAHVLKKLGRHEEAKREDLLAQQVCSSVFEPQPES